MAKRTVTMLIDDLDGSEADESITFGLGGTEYEIDLSKPHADQLRAALEPFVNAGTKLTPHRVTGRTGYARTPARADREQNRAIREWAQSKGMDVSDRGRIKQDVVDRYNAEAGR